MPSQSAKDLRHYRGAWHGKGCSVIGSISSLLGPRVMMTAFAIVLAASVNGLSEGVSAAPAPTASVGASGAIPVGEVSLRSSRIQRFPAAECAGTRAVLSPDGRYLFTDNFTADRTKDHICVIDVRSKRLVTRIRLVKKEILGVTEFNLSRDGRYLYVDAMIPHRLLGPSFVENRLIKVDTRTFRMVAAFTPEEENASGLVEGMSFFGLTGTSTRAVLVARHSGERSTIYRADVDAETLEVLTHDAPAHTAALLLSGDESTIWALGKNLAKIDARTGEVLVRAREVGGPWPRFGFGDVAMSPDERTLYISDTKRRELIAVDAATLKVRERVRIARQVWTIATHPSSGNLWALTSEILPRVPVDLPPEVPKEIWHFNPKLRKTGRIVLPSVGGAETLSFAPTGRQAYVTFRYFPRPSEVMVVPASKRS